MAAVLGALAALAAATAALVLGGVAPPGCPDGFAPLERERLAELIAAPGGDVTSATGRPDVGRPEGGKPEVEPRRGLCLRDGARLPEALAERRALAAERDARLATGSPAAHRAAVVRRDQLAGTDIAGTAGTWRPLGKGPLRGDDPRFPSASGTGFVKLAGRVTDFAQDRRTGRLLAAVQTGGVFASTDEGKRWTAIGDGLPTQSVGAVGWTAAGGGTVIALTGDNSFSGYSEGGLGAYWSSDLGATWHRARGLPDGAMAFRVAIAADRPEVVYAATGFGLYRSSDAGRSYEDVVLPTGPCAGRSGGPGCFFANVVTDVVAQAADEFGNRGGAVLAAVGWHSGPKPNPDGSVQAPANGVYVSDSGDRGTFERASGGFPGTDRAGRISLAAADGADQNHDYVYALVQDSQLFREGRIESIDAPTGDPLGVGIDPTRTPTYLEGVYVSADFGRTWTRMASRQQFLNPASGSSLAPLSAIGFGPGIQAWFNNFVAVDPQSQAGGIPTRVIVGLEEIWETRTVGAPQAGPTDFVVVGPYNATGTACILVIAGEACAAKQEALPLITTTHPDQHGAIFIPGDPGSILVVGNDGGVYTQPVPPAGNLTQIGFGEGANEGFDTLLAYSASRSRDGITWMGLQDNGTARIQPDGSQAMAYGGDGTYVLSDPDRGAAALAATPNGGLVLTQDGGATWAPADPPDDTGAAFLAPFVLDEGDARGVAFGSQQIFFSDTRIADVRTETWDRVFDLGTAKQPGQAGAQPSAGDPARVATALAVQGRTVYAGWCGSCDPVGGGERFASGIATNASGRWRFARAHGLPRRFVGALATDPADPRVVYAGLGVSASRPYAPPGATGDDGVEGTGGVVYRSADGGETFTDITGDLPRAGVTALRVHEGRVVAGTAVGAFAARTREGGGWGLLGPLRGGLPAAPVFGVGPDPADENRIVVATLGRGAWTYEFADPPARPGAGCRDLASPLARLVSVRRERGRIVLRGRASDRGCRPDGRGYVKRVQVAIARSRGKTCRHMRKDGRFDRRVRSCRKPRFLGARGHKRWRFEFPRRVAGGRYVVRVRAYDEARNRSRTRVRRVRIARARRSAR